MIASISVGPSPARARSRASVVTWYTASGSLPSTRTPAMPYPAARSAITPAVCFDNGVEIAHWLFWQTKITGALTTPARLHASWKSPSDVDPSPK